MRKARKGKFGRHLAGDAARRNLARTDISRRRHVVFHPSTLRQTHESQGKCRQQHAKGNADELTGLFVHTTSSRDLEALRLDVLREREDGDHPYGIHRALVRDGVFAHLVSPHEGHRRGERCIVAAVGDDVAQAGEPADEAQGLLEVLRRKSHGNATLLEVYEDLRIGTASGIMIVAPRLRHRIPAVQKLADHLGNPQAVHRLVPLEARPLLRRLG